MIHICFSLFKVALKDFCACNINFRAIRDILNLTAQFVEFLLFSNGIIFLNKTSVENEIVKVIEAKNFKVKKQNSGKNLKVFPVWQF